MVIMSFCIAIVITSLSLRLIIAVNDDDIVSSPNIPFCRQGHSQITIGHKILATQHLFKEQILVFGGKGINYKEPDTMLMNDLWMLKLFDALPSDHSSVKTDVSAKENNENEQYGERRYISNLMYDLRISSVPYFEWRQIDQLASSVWPNKRWNFGFTSVYLDENILPRFVGRTSNDDIMKSNSKLLIYGGESDLYRGFYSSGLDNTKFLSDLWLLVNETYWMRIYDENDFFLGSPGENTYESATEINNSRFKNLEVTNLDTSSNGKGRYNMLRQQFPGPRKGAMLVTLPISQTVVLFGGEGLFVEDKKASDRVSTEGVSGSDGQEAEGTVIKRITVTCISDIFTLNVTAAILSHNSLPEVWNDDDSFHRWNIWGRGSRYSGPCLIDAAAVGILDPTDKVEKMLIFGGRYIPSPSSTSSSSPGASSYRSGSSSDQNAQNDILLGDTSYVYNRNILLYDPLQKKWSSISAAGCWPAGRHDHSLSYSHDTRSVFLSGGRQDGAKTSQSSSNSSSDSINSECDYQGKAENADSTTDMELWTFDLATRSWRRQWHPHPRRNLKSRKLPESEYTVTVGGQWGSKGASSSNSNPDGRYYHGMSLMRASRSGGGDEGSVDNSMQVVVFGGQYHPYSQNQQQQQQQPQPQQLLSSDQILDRDRHSEMNDVWMYRFSETAVPVSQSSTAESGWVLVSSGGCHVGDKGIVEKPIVDTSALFLVYALAGSALLGVLFYHAMSKLVFPKPSTDSSHSGSLFQIEMRNRNGYLKIPDEAVVQQ